MSVMSRQTSSHCRQMPLKKRAPKTAMHSMAQTKKLKSGIWSTDSMHTKTLESGVLTTTIATFWSTLFGWRRPSHRTSIASSNKGSWSGRLMSKPLSQSIGELLRPTWSTATSEFQQVRALCNAMAMEMPENKRIKHLIHSCSRKVSSWNATKEMRIINGRTSKLEEQ